MTRDEALGTARTYAESHQWPWREPVRAESFHKWWLGPARWRVISNADHIGMNVFVEIDDSSGQVVKANYIPR